MNLLELNQAVVIDLNGYPENYDMIHVYRDEISFVSSRLDCKGECGGSDIYLFEINMKCGKSIRILGPIFLYGVIFEGPKDA